MRSIVISDVHLGPGGPLTIFREVDALVEMLKWIAGSEPTEVILAGDTFDFLQCSGYRGFDASQAPSHFEEIASNRGSAAVLTALGAIVRERRHRVVVLSGNHDPELLLPSVRTALQAKLGGPVVWADDKPLRAATGEDPAIWGHSIPFGAGAAWIVHGDRWDPHNFIDREAVVRDAELPAGSHLVYEVLARITPGHPWVNELKPEFPAVFLLHLYIEPQATLRLLSQHLGLDLELLLGAARAWARLGPCFDPAERPEPDPSDLAAWLGANVGRELGGADRIADMEEWLRWGSGQGALADHRGAGRALLRAWLRSIRRLDRFGELDGPDSIPGDAERFLPDEVGLLVAGHTHGRRCGDRGRVSYVNTGTWLPVTRIPAGDLEEWIDRLERGEPWPSASPRTFAVVEPGGSAGLWTWTDAHHAEELGHA